MRLLLTGEHVTDEGRAYGVAFLAGVALGLYEDVQEASSLVELHEEVTEPQQESVALYEECYEAYRSLYTATKDAMRGPLANCRRYGDMENPKGWVDNAMHGHMYDF